MEKWKNGTKLKDEYGEYIYKDDGCGNLTLYKLYEEDENKIKYETPDYSFFADEQNSFEILEDEEIDVQSIEKLDEWITRRNGEVTQTEGKILDIANKTNELLKAIKQLDLKIKEKE